MTDYEKWWIGYIIVNTGLMLWGIPRIFNRAIIDGLKDKRKNE